MSTRLPEALSTPRDMSLQASVELGSEHEVLQAQLAEAYGAALAERDREIAELSARLADAGNGGPPALTALQGMAEIQAP